MNIFYKEPFYKGSHSLVEWSVGIMIVILIFISNSLILSIGLAVCFYVILLKVTPIVVLCQEKIIVKYPVRLINRTKEISYNNCISIEDAITSEVSNRYSIFYFENRIKKEISLFIIDKRTYLIVKEFLQKKNKQLKIKINTPLF